MDNHLSSVLIIRDVLQSLSGLITLPGVLVYGKKILRFTRQFNRNMLHQRENALQTQLNSKDQLLKNIYQELHDNIGNVLTLVKLHLGSIHISNNAPAAGKIHQSMVLLERAVNDLRDLSRAVQPDLLDEAGLAAAIRNDIESVRKSGLIYASLKVKGKEVRLGIAREIVILRMLQEALGNVLKHANATVIEVELLYLQKDMVMIIKDNGKGFSRDLIGQRNHNGNGLNNLFSRTQLIGGAIHIDTAPGCGTTICFSVPLKIGMDN